MKQLTIQQFEKAAEFVKSQARPLDQALFSYHLKGGPAGAVMAELERFQNGDGGFGNALEPDIRLAASSPIVTTVAFQHLKEIGASDLEDIVKRGVSYFVSTYDAGRNGWTTVSKEVNDAPHAPWWQYNEDGAAFDQTGWANPSAEIVGYLHEYSGLVPAGLLSEVTERAKADVEALPDAIDTFAMFCYLRLLDTVPETIKSPLLDKLKRSARLGLDSDKDWPGTGAEILSYAPSPDSYLAETLADEIESQLDEEITKQADNGSWLPDWTWGGQYEEAWQVAEREWRGYLTVQTLKVLWAYGRIEGT